MNYPWMVIAGSWLIGWLLMEVLAVFGKCRIPLPMNFMGALACALIAGGLVL